MLSHPLHAPLQDYKSDFPFLTDANGRSIVVVPSRTSACIIVEVVRLHSALTQACVATCTLELCVATIQRETVAWQHADSHPRYTACSNY
jgi:hypothetical protein